MVENVIEMKGSLKGIRLESMLLQQIKNELLQSFPDLQNVRMNVDLINQICNVIENTLSGKKVNKLEMFMKIHKYCFGVMEPKDAEIITNIIEYLHKNDKIKARSILNKIYRFLKSLVVKK